MYDRRHVLATAAALGGVAGGCLGRRACEASTNHLYVENHLSEPATAAVRVYRVSDGVFGGGSSDLVFSDTLDVPGRRRITVESVYDVQGTYRTEAEHASRFESWFGGGLL